MRGLFAIPAVAAIVVGIVSFTGATSAQPPDQADDSLGEKLFLAQCASCHGAAGEGVEDRGPDLIDEGEAAVDFVLRTGRMPMAMPHMQAKRGPVRYSEEQIVALVSYAGSFGDGPAIPVVDITAGDVVAGGELYRINCAACHVASGSGAAIGGGREAPSLMEATPTEIAQAVIVGPGAMPRFAQFSQQDHDDVAAYVVALQELHRESAVRDFGGAGPVAEGLAAWLLGLIPLVALTRWIGSPHEGRDRDANPDAALQDEVVS